MSSKKRKGNKKKEGRKKAKDDKNSANKFLTPAKRER